MFVSPLPVRLLAFLGAADGDLAGRAECEGSGQGFDLVAAGAILPVGGALGAPFTVGVPDADGGTPELARLPVHEAVEPRSAIIVVIHVLELVVIVVIRVFELIKIVKSDVKGHEKIVAGHVIDGAEDFVTLSLAAAKPAAIQDLVSALDFVQVGRVDRRLHLLVVGVCSPPAFPGRTAS